MSNGYEEMNKAHEMTYKEAMFYETCGEKVVHCFLCPHNCRIKPGKTGLCKARKNIGGKLHTMNYGRVTSAAMDPIEKKPLKMFHPGTYILSVGTFGCNFKCSFCQNWQISQLEAQSKKVSVTGLVETAVSMKEQGNIGIAYTYNEPFIWYEFVYDCCRAAKEKGLLNVLVTNGFVQTEPLVQIVPFIDALNIDLKAFNDDFYKSFCNGTLNEVKRTVEYCADKCHVELTTLIIPGENDSEKEIRELSKWVASVNAGIPLHLTRFFPNHEMKNAQPTPVDTLKRLHEIALGYLNNVYIGNV
ncbi:MAG: AmmeMemoRadiSam system radical SAM enzyme [Eubacteriales bacterium]|nr:AmmeMemoRadiSam system radical SAM enzyme [Eubacteriales bacterium]